MKTLRVVSCLVLSQAQVESAVIDDFLGGRQSSFPTVYYKILHIRDEKLDLLKVEPFMS